MHRGLFAALLLFAPGAVAQVPYHGTLGIYDDPVHTQPFGDMEPLVSKTIYLGVDLDDPSWGSFLEGLEFSVAGLDAVFVLGMEVQPPPTVIFGDIHAPIDMQNGSGGLAIGWSSYIPDNSVSIALQIISGAPPSDHEFLVLRRFPPSWPDLPYPLAIHDAGVAFLRMPLIGGTYRLNPTIATESRTWSAVKHLYQSP
jgi:hypothetical protein